MIQWILTHKEEIVTIYLAAVGLASAIIKVIPPLPADSKWLPIIKFIAKFIALNKSVKDNERPIV